MIDSIVYWLLYFATKFLKLIYYPYYMWYKSCAKKVRCPPVYEHLFFMPAEHLAECIRTRQMKSYNIVNAYINRAKEVHEILNVIVQERFEAAKDEAKRADDFVVTSGLTTKELKKFYPLLGVPLTVKESIGVSGMSNNCGVVSDHVRKASKDADCIQQLKSVGAIIILVSNTPEFCLNWETSNLLTGRTSNPYDSRRTCGGSSGGESVLLATCGSVVGVGSDALGSLRLPPVFCGIFGHRPSAGVVSANGHFPDFSGESWATIFTMGPLCRYAVDLPFVLELMIKPASRYKLKLHDEINPKAIKIYYVENEKISHLTGDVESSIKNAIINVASQMKNEGYMVEKVILKTLQRQVPVTFIPFLSIDDFQYLLPSPSRYILLEMFRCAFGCPTLAPNAIFLFFIRKLYKLIITKEHLERNEREKQDLLEEVADILRNDGVLLYPAFTDVAHYHGQIYSKTLDTSYLGIWSVLGFPVTTCPVGMSKEGLPTSIQLVTTPFNDRLSLTLAREIEKIFGGWTPPKYEQQIV